ncbi:hypothetical protein ACWENA_31735 [Streptomyces sp. NPDC004779]
MIGPEDGGWLARFTRPVPADQSTDVAGAHWKQEIDRGFAEAPCTDMTTAP